MNPMYRSVWALAVEGAVASARDGFAGAFSPPRTPQGSAAKRARSRSSSHHLDGKPADFDLAVRDER